MLTFVGGELENLQIHFVRNGAGVRRTKPIVGEAKVAAREHLFAKTIVGERTGLSHQRIDHVTVVDARGLLANETLHRLNQAAPMSDRDCLGANSNVDFHSDQATGHGVRVGSNVDRRALADADALLRVVCVES